MMKKVFCVIAFLFTLMAMPCSAEPIRTPCSMEGMICFLSAQEIEFREKPSLDSKFVGESIVSFEPIKVRLLKRQGTWGRVEYEAMNVRGGIEKTIGWIQLKDAYQVQERGSVVQYSKCFLTSGEKVCIDLILNAKYPLQGILRTERSKTGTSELYHLNGKEMSSISHLY